MGSEWESIQFKDLYKEPSRNGLTKPSKIRGEGTKFINMKEIFAYDRMRNIPCERAPLTEKEKGSSLLEAGDLLFARQSLVLEGAGKCSIFLGDDEPATFESHLIRVRLDEQKVDSDFAYNFFKSPQGRGSLYGITEQGAGAAGIRGSDLGLIEFPLPPLPEQKTIAHILGTLDEKIELNRRMNATLEGMAQALFKSWFVDFDPVIDNALAAGNPIPEALAPRAEVRKKVLADGTTQQDSVEHPTLSAPKALFPAAFHFTEELGWIPEGWEVGCISDLAALNPESWTAKKHPDSVNYVDLANTKDGRINETTAYEFGEAPSRARRVLKQHDTIIGTVRPGNRSFAYIHDDGLTGSTGFAALRPNEIVYRSFIYLGLTRDEVIEVFAHLADGAAYPAIRPEVVGNTQITVPSSGVLQLFEDQAAPLIAKVGEHQKEAETLSRLRDTLLPRLISGQLTTKD